jgi:hypothetical protein
MRMLVALIVWIGAVTGAIALSTAISNANKGTSTASPAAAQTAGPTSTSTTAGASGSSFQFGAVKSTDSDSLFVGSNFKRALGVARQHLGPRANIESVLVTPGRLLLTVLSASNGTQYASVLANDRYGIADGGQLVGSQQVFYLSQVGVNVPSGLLKRIHQRAHVGLASIRSLEVQTDKATQSFYWAVHQTNSSSYFLAPNALDGPLQEVTGTRKVTLR